MPAFQELYLKHFDALLSDGNTLPEDYTGDALARAKLQSWQNRCLNLIEKAFGEKSSYYESLREVMRYYVDNKLRLYFIETLKGAKLDYELLTDANNITAQNQEIGPLSYLERIFTRFHLVARQLRERYGERNTLDVNDEYDVQDLIHGLLRINFENIRKEEWTPSYAGTCSRMDFLLKNEGIVIEAKKTREGLTAKVVADQLIVDIERYQTHPDCKMLLCFIYDPEGRITSPESIESDMSKPHGNIEVKVIVSPKGT